MTRALLLGLVLGAGAGCRNPVEPTGPDRTAHCVIQQTAYTHTIPPAPYHVNACYNTCPPDVEALAAGVNGTVLYDTACPH